MEALRFVVLNCLVLLFSCHGGKREETISFLIEREGFEQLPLSEIAEDIQAIELEVTDSSLIGNWREGSKIFPLDEYIVYAEGSRAKSQLLLFDKKGKFIRTIGKKGQGPGEYLGIRVVTVDNQAQHIYVGSSRKIICYDFRGQYLFEKTSDRDIEDIYFYQDQILLFSTFMDNDKYNRTVCYKADKKLNIVDSLIVQEEERNINFIIVSGMNDPLSICNKRIYYHRPKLVSTSRCDTLLEIKNKDLIPSVRLTKGEGHKYFLRYMFRSSRFVCVGYCVYPHYYFCYDIKTGKGYNLEKGYTDDIYCGENVEIRPFPHDSERFYYLHTTIKDTDKDEPNPTLYIGRFKQ